MIKSLPRPLLIGSNQDQLASSQANTFSKSVSSIILQVCLQLQLAWRVGGLACCCSMNLPHHPHDIERLFLTTRRAAKSWNRSLDVTSEFPQIVGYKYKFFLEPDHFFFLSTTPSSILQTSSAFPKLQLPNTSPLHTNFHPTTLSATMKFTSPLLTLACLSAVSFEFPASTKKRKVNNHLRFLLAPCPTVICHIPLVSWPLKDPLMVIRLHSMALSRYATLSSIH